MKPTPKLIFGGLCLLFIILIASLFILRLPHDTKSTAEIVYFENKFKLKFNILNIDEQKFNTFTSAFNFKLPENNEIKFELDSTASAQLSVKTPITAQLDIDDKQISFNGETDEPKEKIEEIVLPVVKNAIISLYSSSFSTFLQSNGILNYQEFRDRLEAGQYLYLFPNKQYLLVVQSNENNFQKILEFLKTKPEEIEYKEELADEKTFHLAKLINSPKQNVTTLYENGKTIFITNNQELITGIISEGTLFPKNRTSSVAIALDNSENKINEEILGQLLESSYSAEKLKPMIDKVKRLEFTLYGSSFSGLINLK